MGILKQLEADYEFDIVNDFLTHYGIMSDLLEPLIIKLSNRDYFDNSVDEIFRIVHNIKSASSFLQLEPLMKLSALSEEILDDLRAYKNTNSAASDELVDWLLLVADEFKLYRNDIENDELYFHFLSPAIIKIPTKILA